MTTQEKALKEYTAWLPGELAYSAQEAPYYRKLRRASLPIEDGESMHSFLGAQWHTGQRAVEDGLYYQPFHGKSAQSMFAKFAAGIFDKVALGLWLASRLSDTSEHVLVAAEVQSKSIIKDAPWQEVDPAHYDVGNLRELPFADTPFSAGIAGIMSGIERSSRGDLRGAERVRAINEFKYEALSLGGLATAVYQDFAVRHLADDQLTIPQSEHSETKVPWPVD